MKLRNPAFEGPLRLRIRAELRQSEEGWAEYRRRRNSRPRPWRRTAWLVAVGVFWAGFVAFAVAHDRHGAAVPRLSLALFGLGLSLCLADVLPGLFADAFGVLGHHPVPDRALARLAMRWWLLSTGWFLLASAVFFAALAVGGRGGGVGVAAALGLAALNWGGVLGIACALAAWRPRWASALAGVILCVAAIVLFIAKRQFGPDGASVAARATAAIPTGWASHALSLWLRDGGGAGTLALLAAGALAALPFASWRRIAASLEQVQQPPSAGADLPSRVTSDRHPPWWSSGGPLESALVATLSPRQRAVADFLFAGDVAWSKSWRMSAMVAAVGIAVALALDPAPAWTIWIPLALVGLGMLGGIAAGITTVPQGGVQILSVALYPLGYGEIFGVLWRAWLLRLLAWAPLLFGLLAATATDLGIPVAKGLAYGAKGLLVYVAVRPLLLVSSLSEGLREAVPLGLARIGMLVVLALALCSMLGGGFLLFRDAPLPAAGGAALLVVPPFVLLAILGRRIGRGRLDQMRQP